MSLSNVLEKIKKVQPFALEDTTSGPIETLRARRGRKNQAIEEFTRLKKEYETELRRTAAFILVVGDKRQDFNDLAVQNYKCFSSDPNNFFSDLAGRVPQSLYMGKEGLPNLFDILGRHLEDKMLALDVIGYPQLIYRQEYAQAIRNTEDFATLVRRAVVEQVGGEIVGVQAIRNLADDAINQGHSSKFTPIMLPTNDEKFALTIARDLEKITPRIFVVAAGKVSKLLKSYQDTVYVKEVTNETVESALKTISNTLKK